MAAKGTTTFYYTSEFDRMRAFYEEALGLEPNDGGPSWVAFRMGQSQFAFHLARGDAPPNPTIPHVDFVVDDLDAELERWRAAGATILRERTDEAFGHSAQVEDPEGRRFLLVAYGG